MKKDLLDDIATEETKGGKAKQRRSRNKGDADDVTKGPEESAKEDAAEDAVTEENSVSANEDTNTDAAVGAEDSEPADTKPGKLFGGFFRMFDMGKAKAQQSESQAKPMIYTNQLELLVYTGEEPYEVRVHGRRPYPVMRTGDMILLERKAAKWLTRPGMEFERHPIERLECRLSDENE